MSDGLCDGTKRYLASAGDDGQPPPPAVRLHLAECESCGRLAGRYRSAVTAFANATAALPLALPDFRAVRDAAQTAPRQADWWAWLRAPWLVPALAFAAVAAVGVGWWLSRVQDGADPQPGRLTVVERGGSASPELHTSLDEGERVVVPAEGSVVLSDPAAATLTLAGASEVEVVSWRTDQVLRLTRGEVRAAVRKRQPGRRFEVRTANAVVSVVGTEFVVRAASDGVTHVQVTEGVVEVASPDGRRLALLRAGESLDVPAEPRLAQASEIANEPEHLEEAPIEAPLTPPVPAIEEPPTMPVMPEEARDPKARPDRKDKPAPVAVPAPDSTPALDPPATTSEPTGVVAPPAPLAPPVPVAPTSGNSAEPEQVAQLGQPARTEADDDDDPGVETDDQPERSALLREAKKLLRARREAEAIDVLTRGLRYGGPDQPRVLKLLGRAHDVVGKLERKAAAWREEAKASSGARRAVLIGKLARLLDQRLNRGQEAGARWDEYLGLQPDGKFAPQAHWALARADLSAGRRASAKQHLETLLVQFPRARETEHAFDRLGKMLLDSGDFRGAAHHYEPFLGDAESRRAEAAFAGLMRARLGEGRSAEARSLAAAYFRRFPEGARRVEIESLLRRAGKP